jgi:transcriptional regulator with XRE-family HTH domain
MARQFGEKLRHLRLERGMTQAELAQQLQLASHSHINNLEAGRRAPSLDLILRVSSIFRTTTDYLLRDSIPIEMVATNAATSIIPHEEETARQFGSKLRHLRKQRNLTQVELAEALQLRTQAHLSLLESGRSEPSINFALQLADFFGVTTDYLLCDDKPVEENSE